MSGPTVLLLLSLLAQDSDPGWNVRGSLEPSRRGARLEAADPDEAFLVSVGAFGRLSWPFGAVEDRDVVILGNTFVFPDHLRYGDLFDGGEGFALEATVLFVRLEEERGRSERRISGPCAGLYASLQVDRYEGDRAGENDTRVDPDDLDLAAAFVGLKVVADLGGGAFGELHLGGGIVRYGSVDARVSVAGGGEETQELFQETRSWAAELRYRFSARLGPLALEAGFGLRFMGGPREGDGSLGDALDPHAFGSVDLDLGVELGF